MVDRMFLKMRNFVRMTSNERIIEYISCLEEITELQANVKNNEVLTLNNSLTIEVSANDDGYLTKFIGDEFVYKLLKLQLPNLKCVNIRNDNETIKNGCYTQLGLFNIDLILLENNKMKEYEAKLWIVPKAS